MDGRSSERIARKRAREEELDETKAASSLVSIKETTPQTTGFSFKTEGIDPFASLTPLLTTIYGENVVSQWKASGKPVRNIWELTPPPVQCSRVLNPPSKCWICGGAFDQTKFGLKAICDHVLPIAQSVFFLSLYASSKKKDIVDDSSKKIFELEYEWAHDICNTSKSSKIFIKPISGQQGLKVDVNAINAFLTELSRITSVKPGADVIRYQLSTPMLINSRAAAMKTRLEEITQFLNGPISRGEGNLQLLAQTSSYVDPTTVHPKFYELLTKGGRKTFRRRNNGKSVRRSTAKGHGSTSRTYRKIRTSTRKRT